MTFTNAVRWLAFAAVLLPLSPSEATGQTLTGAITGRATDSSGLALPGVTVTIASPQMIGEPRSTVTDDQGSYRFTLLPAGEYTVTFALTGFNTLNIEGVKLAVGATMTINGQMTVATLQETVTVTSQAPTIDLESANVSVHWDQQKLDEIPYSRSLTGLIMLVPGLYATSYDVGGSSFGTGSGPAARTFGRAGGNVVSYDGMIWDQTYGDYGSYEEAQVLTAAKGADTMNPGLSMNLVVKSGSNVFRGLGAVHYQDGKFQADNVDQKLLDRGYSPGVNKFTKYQDYYGEIGGPIKRDRLWFYGSYRDGSSGQYIPGFVSLATGKQVEFFTKLQDPTVKLTYQLSAKNKVEAMAQGGRKWQPYRTASRFVPLEATQNQDSYSLVGPSFKWLSVLNTRSTVEASLQRGGYWWPDVPWTSDVRKTDLTTTTTYGAFLESKRKPRRWQYGGTYVYFADLWGRNHELKTGYLGWYNIVNETETVGYPNQQQYRYRSLAGDTNLFLRPDSVIVYDYPFTVKSGEKYHSLYANDKITATDRLTLNIGLRWDRYSSFLPEQGNPGTGPFSERRIVEFRGEDRYPIYSTLVPRLSAIYDLTGQGRISLRASYGRYVGGGSGTGTNPAPGAGDVNPNASFQRTYTNWDGTIPYVPNPANLASVSGGSTNRTIDSALNGPFVDEYTAGLDIGLSRLLTIQFNYVRKFDGQGNKRLNLALPFEAYTAVSTAVDPGRDNATGTADDRPLTIYAVPRTYSGFGQIVERIVQAGDDEARNRYTAYGVTLSRQLSDGWSFLTAFNADYRDLRQIRPRDPNEALYGPGDATGITPGTTTGNPYRTTVPEWNFSFRMSGTYQLPWGLQYAASLVAQSGDWYGRDVQVRNALNATLYVRAESHLDRLPWVNVWDNRVSKRINLPRNQSVEGIFELFNTLNVNTVTAIVSRNGPTFLQPTAIIAPRVFRLGVRYRF
jgi:hypothetical protein